MRKSQTLGELLTTPLCNRINVKIGSKQGSSFFYCGKGREAIKELNKINKQLVKQNLNTLKILNDRLKNLDKVYEERIKLALAKGKITDTESYIASVNIEKERERARLPKKIQEVQWCIDTHILDRQVQEIVEGICYDEYPCKIVYVKGIEQGKYWLISEYKNKRVEKEDEEWKSLLD